MLDLPLINEIEIRVGANVVVLVQGEDRHKTSSSFLVHDNYYLKNIVKPSGLIFL
jgi:hypothetical protein